MSISQLAVTGGVVGPLPLAAVEAAHTALRSETKRREEGQPGSRETGLGSLDLQHGGLQVTVLFQTRANEFLQRGVGEDLLPGQVAEVHRVGSQRIGIRDGIAEQTLYGYIIGPVILIIYVATVERGRHS